MHIKVKQKLNNNGCFSLPTKSLTSLCINAHQSAVINEEIKQSIFNFNFFIKVLLCFHSQTHLERNDKMEGHWLSNVKKQSCWFSPIASFSKFLLSKVGETNESSVPREGWRVETSEWRVYQRRRKKERERKGGWVEERSSSTIWPVSESSLSDRYTMAR